MDVQVAWETHLQKGYCGAEKGAEDDSPNNQGACRGGQPKQSGSLHKCPPAIGAAIQN